MIEFSGADEFSVGSVSAERLAVKHGFPCCGYVFRERGAVNGGRGVGSLAYISDCHEIPDETIEKIRGVDVMVLNCLRERPHPTHLSLENALAYIGRIAPKKAYLVHMCHDLTHGEWLARLAGTNVEPAYDGLELNG
jgi:phosphoribosyl 1,2-cyclic phosphate phosphodiesterase